VQARPWLEQLEIQLVAAPLDEAFAPLAFLAAQDLRLDEDELRAARRRALLVLAAGGDPRRTLGPHDRAVSGLAGDLDRPERRARLAAALTSLEEQATGLPAVTRAVAALRGDPELAWRWLACALLADEIADETV
jgi:hypothetical protein